MGGQSVSLFARAAVRLRALCCAPWAADAGALAVALAIWLSHFGLLLTGERTLFFRDLMNGFYSSRTWLAPIFAAGNFPLWDPHLACGETLIGWAGSILFTPLNALFVLFPLTQAYNLFLTLHPLFGAVGFYLLLRRLPFGRLPSTAGAIIFAFSGFSLSLVCLPGALVCLAFLPWVLLAMDRLLQFRSAASFSIASMAWAILFFVPELSFVFVTICAGGILHMVAARRHGLSRPGIFILYGLTGVAGAMLAAVQLLPTAAALSDSVRGSGQMDTGWSVHPAQFLEFLFPRLLGDPLGSGAPEQWGLFIHDQLPYILSIHLGATSLLLAAWGALRGSGSVRTVFLTCSAVGLLLALGRHTPFLHLVETLVPPLGYTRFPVKFLLLNVFGVAGLAALGLERWEAQVRQRPPAGVPGRGLWITFGAGLAVLAALTLAGTVPWSSWIHDAVSARVSPSPRADRYIGTSLSLGLSFLVAGCGLLGAALSRPSVRRPAGLALLAILGFETFLGAEVNPDVSTPFFVAAPPITQALQMVDRRRERLFVDEQVRIPDNVVRGATNSRLWVYLAQRRRERPHFGVMDGYRYAFNADRGGFHSRQQRVLRKFFEQSDWPTRVALLRAASVRYVIDRRVLEVPGLRFTGQFETGESLPARVYLVEQTVPRAALLGRALFVDSETAALKALGRPGFDPAEEVILLGAQAREEAGPGHAGSAGEVNWILDEPDQLEWSVQARQPAYLVVSDSFDEGWQATIDGRDARLLRAQFAYRALPLPQGSHRVRMVFRPKSYSLGALVSAFGWAACLIVLTGAGANRLFYDLARRRRWR